LVVLSQGNHPAKNVLLSTRTFDLLYSPLAKAYSRKAAIVASELTAGTPPLTVATANVCDESKMIFGHLGAQIGHIKRHAGTDRVVCLPSQSIPFGHEACQLDGLKGSMIVMEGVS